MKNFLDYLIDKYKSAEEYLLHIEVSQENISVIKKYFILVE